MKGKVVLITGASLGIGRAAAELMASRGAIALSTVIRISKVQKKTASYILGEIITVGGGR